MSDLSHIPLEELKQDLSDSISDANWCRFALNLGITVLPSGGDVQYRLQKNEEFISIISVEIARRENDGGEANAGVCQQ